MRLLTLLLPIFLLVACGRSYSQRELDAIYKEQKRVDTIKSGIERHSIVEGMTLAQVEESYGKRLYQTNPRVYLTTGAFAKMAGLQPEIETNFEEGYVWKTLPKEKAYGSTLTVYFKNGIMKEVVFNRSKPPRWK